ncbi:AAA family ATPase [Litorilinea aerophila]|uniref:AAA family ATPase n=1 Tax=Litorilinea aerophila TaxID=1204385 RepID=UPI001E434874|nr:MoxR family ATPase [Litorilinea aerophila]GIV75655.1 MAG: ATPase [Litorilinea sp.]
MAVEEIQRFAQKVSANVERVIVGKQDVVEVLIIALLCEGHVLLEDVPGVGKTMLARALALSLDADFRRLQCTPDLLPSDITGVSVFNQETRQFQFVPGPAFTHILLADEINRATPRAQAALLECMGERQVTVDGVTRPLPRPFLVLATQNPIEYEGTFPLPEAQLDRFLFKLSVGYLSPEQESQMLVNLGQRHPIETLEKVVDGAEIPRLAEQVWQVRVDESLRNYIVALTQATRRHPDLTLGASPRGALALYRGAQARAALHGRDYVLPDDIQALVPLALPHRCIVNPESALRGRTAQAILAEIMEQTPLDLGDVD